MVISITFCVYVHAQIIQNICILYLQTIQETQSKQKPNFCFLNGEKFNEG